MNDDLSIIEQRTVIFYEDEITAVLVEQDGKEVVYVPIRPICDFLGVTIQGQRQRINRDPVLSEAVQGVNVTFTPADGVPQTQQMLCLPLIYLNGWLFGMNANRVKPEIKDRLIRYQKECYEVLAEAFLTTGDDDLTFSSDTTVLERLHAMAQVIAHTTGQMLENRRRLDKAAQVVGDINKRLRVVEQRTVAGSLTEEQAQEIKKLVNAIALKMSEAEPGKSHYPAVYAALSEQTGSTSYKRISPKGYHAAVAFLSEWLLVLQRSD